MLKILIADDEEIIRKGIRKILLKSNLEIEIVGEASDGEFALSLAKKYKPDLMLIDINMPFINGLEFLELIKNYLPETLSIIISGYDQFEYARKALQLGVIDYLLKPIDYKKLIDTVSKAIANYNKSKQKKEHNILIQNELEENKVNIQQNFLKMCLEKEIYENTLLKKIDLLNIENKRPMALIIIYDKERELIQYINLKGYRFYKEDYLILINIINEGIEEIRTKLEQKFLKITGYERVIGIATLKKGILSLNKTYYYILNEMESNKHISGNIVRIIEYIKENYCNCNITLKQVANQFHVSPSYLTRIMRQKLGVSFIEYLTRLRITKAIELLKITDEDIYIYDIAKNIGYNSQHYFSRIFKNRTGLSPKEYKNKLSEK